MQIKKWQLLTKQKVNKFQWKKLYFTKLNKQLNKMINYKINKFQLKIYMI